MPRHYSKVFVQLPDAPSDPPYAIVTMDCDVCGEEELRIHMQHLGTVLRCLAQTVDDLGTDDGTTQAFSPLLDSTPTNKEKLRRFLDDQFPGWKAERLRRR